MVGALASIARIPPTGFPLLEALAEACGNRTHLARVRRHAGFEDQEGHQAQSASEYLSHLVARDNWNRLHPRCKAMPEFAPHRWLGDRGSGRRLGDVALHAPVLPGSPFDSGEYTIRRARSSHPLRPSPRRHVPVDRLLVAPTRRRPEPVGTRRGYSPRHGLAEPAVGRNASGDATTKALAAARSHRKAEKASCSVSARVLGRRANPAQVA